MGIKTVEPKVGRKPLNGKRLQCTISPEAMRVLDEVTPKLGMSAGAFISLLILNYNTNIEFRKVQ